MVFVLKFSQHGNVKAPISDKYTEKNRWLKRQQRRVGNGKLKSKEKLGFSSWIYTFFQSWLNYALVYQNPLTVIPTGLCDFSGSADQLQAPKLITSAKWIWFKQMFLHFRLQNMMGQFFLFFQWQTLHNWDPWHSVQW